jgi:hypothetical protein
MLYANAQSHPFSLSWLRTESHQTPIEIERAAIGFAAALAAVAAPEKLQGLPL